jgi:hypothetical protein
MLGLSTLIPRDPFNLVVLAVGVLSIFVLATFAIAFKPKGETSNFQAYLKFAYACFLKPHTGDENGDQQDALVGCADHEAAHGSRYVGKLLQGPGGCIRCYAHATAQGTRGYAGFGSSAVEAPL